MRDRPELHEVPVIVGGGHRGVVLAANYPARAFGVRSAMTGTRARRLCPQAVVLQPDYDSFAAVSTAVMEIFRRVTPLVEVVSLDEAFLDVARRRCAASARPGEIAEQLRATIHDEQGITCSVGIAASISVAKLASRRAKPDGVVLVVSRSRWRPSCTPSTWATSTASVRRPARCCTASAWSRWATSPTPRRRPCSAPSARHLGAHLHHLAWGTDRREVAPQSGGVFGHGARTGEADPTGRWGPSGPSPATPMTAPPCCRRCWG